MTLGELAAKRMLRAHRNLHLSIHSHFPCSATPVVLRGKAVAGKIKGRPILNWTTSNVGCNVLKDQQMNFKTIAHNTVFYLCQVSRKITTACRMRVIREHHQKGAGAFPTSTALPVAEIIMIKINILKGRKRKPDIHCSCQYERPRKGRIQVRKGRETTLTITMCTHWCMHTYHKHTHFIGRTTVM